MGYVTPRLLRFSFIISLILNELFLVSIQSASIGREGEDLVVYQLFTRNNPTYRQTVRLNDLTSLQNSNFDRALPTKIYAVGWDDDTSTANSTRDEYLIKEDCNFFAVDWQAYASLVPTNDPAGLVNATQEAGYHLAAFIDFLVKNGARLSTFHLIGHSAGDHLVGAAGSAVTLGRIPRITGLDPAEGGIWDFNNTDTRLDKSDADFVDIMHTNGGRLVAGNIAFYEVMGHVDFYVNGGHKQPGCPPLEFQCCSHCRAVDYFAESINTEVGFYGIQCDNLDDYEAGLCVGNSKQIMGEYTPLTATGVYFVDTNLEAPWAMGLFRR